MQSLLRLPAVKGLTGYSRSQIYLLIKRREFPAPIRLGARSVAWPSNEIHSWIADRIAQSRNGSA